MQKITPFIWFDMQAEEAAQFYTSIFKDSSINNVSHYGKEGFEVHHMPEGTPMVVDFTIAGQRFNALNGGPGHSFTDATSFMISCDSQEEVDYYWDKLVEGGEEVACGWLKDKFGLSWQVTPVQLMQYIGDPDPKKAGAAMAAMMQMKKIDLNKIQEAYDAA